MKNKKIYGRIETSPPDFLLSFDLLVVLFTFVYPKTRPLSLDAEILKLSNFSLVLIQAHWTFLEYFINR